MNNANISLILPSKELTTGINNNSCSLHRHENCEFVMSISGSGESIVNDTSTELHVGTMQFINTAVYHTLNKRSDDYANRDIYISTQRLQTICNTFFDDAFFEFLSTEQQAITIPIDFNAFNSYEQRLRRLQTMITLHPEKKQDLRKGILVIIISILGILYEERISRPIRDPRLESFLLKVSSPNIFSRPISEIVALSSYSYSYFSHLFKTTYNKTFKTYIDELRISFAKTLLVRANCNIVEIANYLGYSSQSHFTKIFREKVGITPYQYRIRQLSKLK